MADTGVSQVPPLRTVCGGVSLTDISFILLLIYFFGVLYLLGRGQCYPPHLLKEFTGMSFPEDLLTTARLISLRYLGHLRQAMSCYFSCQISLVE